MGRSQLQYRKPPKDAASAAAAAAAASSKLPSKTLQSTPNNNIAPQPNRYGANDRHRDHQIKIEEDEEKILFGGVNEYDASLKLRDGEYQTTLLRDKRVEADLQLLKDDTTAGNIDIAFMETWTKDLGTYQALGIKESEKNWWVQDEEEVSEKEKQKLPNTEEDLKVPANDIEELTLDDDFLDSLLS